MQNKEPLFYLIAGEASGDILGSRLMQALHAKLEGKVRFAGVGGPRMQAVGMDLLFDQSELAHMGLFELLRHLPQLLRRIRQTRADIVARRPDAVITIDSPDFCFRVVKPLKGAGIPLIHYVAPTVWAWRPKRAEKISRFLDHLLALLPFEPPYFTAHGLGCSFVGHPLIESGAGQGDAVRFRTSRKISDAAILLAVLPGSRQNEISRLLPVFGDTVKQLHARFPDLQIVLPLVPSLAEKVRAAVAHWPVPVHFTENDDDKYDAFAACRAALACSGTVSVELALAGLPTVIAYKIGALTAALYRRLIKTRYVTLLNIMRGRAVMPEYLQENCTAEKLAQATGDLLADDGARALQTAELHEIAAWLGRGAFVPSEKAADTVLAVAAQTRKG